MYDRDDPEMSYEAFSEGFCSKTCTPNQNAHLRSIQQGASASQNGFYTALQELSIFDPVPSKSMSGAKTSILERLEIQGRGPGFVSLNHRIIEIAAKTLQKIKVYGKKHPKTKEAILLLLEDYNQLLNEEIWNIINCVTLTHRLGWIFSAMDRPRWLSDEAAVLLTSLLVLLSQQTNDLNERQLSNVIWAFGNMGRELLSLPFEETSIPELYSQFFVRIMKLEAFQAQEISNCITGLAKMNFKTSTCQPVLDHLTRLAVPLIDAFNPQEITNCLWALGVFRYNPQNGFMNACLSCLSSNLSTFDPRYIANILWSWARLELRSVHLLPKLEVFFDENMLNFTEHGIPMVFWSFAKLNYIPRQKTFRKAVRVVMGRLESFSTLGLTNFVYACAIFGFPMDPEMAERLKKAFIANKDAFSVQNMCIFVWAMTILFCLDLELFNCVFADPRLQEASLKATEKRQLYQCMVHMQFFVPGGNRALHSLPKKWVQDCCECWEEGQNTKWRDGVCLAVMLQLQKMGYVAEPQFLISKGLARYSVDVVRRMQDSTRMAIEVTIPIHQFRNNPNRIEGPRLWAMKLMERQGLQILQIDAEHWKRLKKDGRIDYLESVIQKASL